MVRSPPGGSGSTLGDGDRLTVDNVTYLVKRQRGARGVYTDRFTLIFEQALKGLAEQRWPSTTWRVLMVAIAQLDFTSWRELRQAELARELGVRQPAVSKAFKHLVEAGWIERQGVRGGTRWRLSADKAWRGRAGAWHAHQRARHGRRA